MFLLLFCLHSAQKMYFSEIQLVCDRRTNGRTDRRTDTPSYRDARTHLKNPTLIIGVTGPWPSQAANQKLLQFRE